MAEPFTPESKIAEVVDRLGERGRDVLRRHGYDVGAGFVDVLSQYQTLEHAYRVERIRDLKGLLSELNASPAQTDAPAGATAKTDQ